MLPPPRHASPLASPDSLASSVPFPPSAEAARMPPPPPPVPTKQSTLLPIEPLPDSLLLRSTFAALDHSAHHLKKLSKAVLATSATVLSLYSQLEAAEDELFSSLGDLASFLDIGNGRIGNGIEDGVFGELGVKSWKRAERRREREAMDKLVVETVTKLKGDVKAHALGLAGSQGAQARFDQTAKQYYLSTSQYLAPAPASSSSSQPTITESDQQHKARTAAFDIARYNYHSTLLRAVPPTSIPCVDALVGVYSWVVSVVGSSERHTRPKQTLSPSASSLSLTTSASGSTFTQQSGNLSQSSTGQTLTLQLASHLSALASYRAKLVTAWHERDHQTQLLERESKPDDATVWVQVSDSVPSAPVPAHKTPKKRRSVGGRLRDFLAPSSSSSALAAQAQGEDRRSRASLDLPARKERSRRSNAPVPSSSFRTPPMDGDTISETSPVESRPPLPSRHSIQLTPGSYTSPFADESPKTTWGGVGGVQGTGDEDSQRIQAGRKKEGVLWGAGAWEGVGGAGKERARWEKFWVVLEHSRIYEYRDGLGKPEPPRAAIDLKFASVREGRGTERRFVFEVVTPSQGRRLYQATSQEEMKAWLYAICNAIESCINGQSTARTFDTAKLRTASGALDDHALPRSHPMLGLGFSGGAGNRRSMPAHPDSRWTRPMGRKTSLKDVIRQSGERLHKAVGGGRSPGVESPASVSGSRTPEGTATSQTPRLPVLHRDSSVIDDEIEASVMAMAGLSADPQRRVFSEAGARLAPESNGGEKMERTRSADEAAQDETPDMAMLRRVAALPENLHCADCGKPMKASRWATINLRGTPMVMFLCIRCCGIHRGLGTHVSKVRSLDLDRWSADAIVLARQWGNERGNALWERLKPADVHPTDENIRDFITSKYVHCRWLAAADAGALLDGAVGTAL